MKLSARTKMITKKMLKKSKMDNKPEAEMEYESKKGGGLFEALHEKKESKSKKMSERKMGGKS